MNSLVSNNTINEISCGTNFAYILNDDKDFLLTEYKVLQSQGNDGFIKCMKMLYNGKIEIYYLTSGYKAFSAMLPLIDGDGFMTICSNLLKCIIDVKTNGFLSCENIDTSLEKIFVEVNTLKVYLVYLPISKKLYDDPSIFENELRSSLIKLIQGISNIQSAKTTQFSVDLSDGTLSLEDLYAGMKVIQPAVKTLKNNQKYRMLKLVAVNAPMHFEMVVNKNEYVIGKNAVNADGVITYNKAVSRVHCKITNLNGKYYITDLGSANGTFVNKVRIPKGQSVEISNGDIVRLANSDFQLTEE